MISFITGNLLSVTNMQKKVRGPKPFHCPVYTSSHLQLCVFAAVGLQIPLFQAGKILALRAKNRLSSVSGREVKCEVLVIWKVNNS